MTTTRRWFVLAVAAVALYVAASPAANWPRFRGPNGTGVAADKDIPVKWDADAVAWKTAVPGVGNSSPVVWGNRLFVQSASADGSQRWLLCLDTADGKIRWTAPVPGTAAHTHQHNTFASSTPATDGERVYALFWDGRDVALYAYDFDGRQLWRHDLGSFKSQHGPGASPVVHGGKVFFANDQDGSSVLVALDARTGATAWEAQRRPFRACYSAPFVLDLPGTAPQLIVSSTAGLTSYDPDTGREHWDWAWKFSGKPLRTIGSPLYHAGMIFATSGDGDGSRHMVALRLDGPGGKPELAWENKRSLPYVPTMLVRGEYLYYVHDKGFAGCCVARTGRTVWTERLGEGVTASPVLVDGKVYAIGERGTVYVFAAAPNYHLLARNSVGEPVMASPAVADGRLFIRGREHLFCIARAPAR